MGVPKEQATGISYGDNPTFLEKGKGVEWVTISYGADNPNGLQEGWGPKWKWLYLGSFLGDKNKEPKKPSNLTKFLHFSKNISIVTVDSWWKLYNTTKPNNIRPPTWLPFLTSG